MMFLPATDRIDFLVEEHWLVAEVPLMYSLLALLSYLVIFSVIELKL